jgi:biotin operon repressor
MIDTSRGFVKFWRSMEDWEWYTDTNTFRVFFHIILKVNYKEKRWQGTTVMPGQIVTSAEGLAEDLHLSRQNIRTALEHLKSTGEITIKTTNKFSLITVANWASYQDNDTQVTSKSTNKITIDQPSTNHQLTTTKEVKKERSNITATVKAVIEEYTADQNMIDALNGWVEMRIAKKKPVTARAMSLALKELDKLEGDKVYLVDYATTKCWERFYQPNNGYSNKPEPKQSSMPVY